MPGIRYNFAQEAASVTPAIQMLMQTYTDNIPYPHKFNDALVKATLTHLDSAIKFGFWKELVEHEVYVLTPILEMIGEKAQAKGPDHGLYGMFEGNSCCYQLFEEIDIRDGERRLKCPFKEMIEIISVLGTTQVTWEDVHEKWCIPLWTSFAKKIGIEIEIIPGETCCVRLKK
ncbi:MAG: hypothetical protein GY868_09300 [Deltaproteobacteria bacterium]|nr:hypothetical protein [Deltaproteobacteria bacterium]